MRKKARRGNYGQVGPIEKEWFLAQLERAGLSTREASRKMGLDPTTLSRTLAGRRRFQIVEARALAEMIAQPLEQVLLHAGLLELDEAAGEPGATVPVVGWVDRAGAVHRGAGLRGPRTVGPLGKDERAAGMEALRFQTDAAGWDGAVAYLPTGVSAGRVAGDVVGKICVVKVRGEKSEKIRVVRRGYRAGFFDLEFLAGGKAEEGVVLDYSVALLGVRF